MKSHIDLDATLIHVVYMTHESRERQEQIVADKRDSHERNEMNLWSLPHAIVIGVF